jgi:hypothetical protein
MKNFKNCLRSRKTNNRILRRRRGNWRPFLKRFRSIRARSRTIWVQTIRTSFQSKRWRRQQRAYQHFSLLLIRRLLSFRALVSASKSAKWMKWRINHSYLRLRVFHHWIQMVLFEISRWVIRIVRIDRLYSVWIDQRASKE